ncbi:MAG: acyl-CoA thioesterase [Alphaproteobacteria bacterium]|nr:acyl-CoA thioesterase [Alphaproteobacteria bacterium]
MRVGDLDTMGHVNHAVIVSYFEDARMAVMDLLVRRPGFGFVLGEVSVRYLAEIRRGEPVLIGTNVTRIGNKSFTLGQGLFVGDTCAATCLGTEVVVDLETRRGAPLPDEYRAVLERYR